MASKNQAVETAKKYIIVMAFGGMLVLGVFLMLARPWRQTPNEEVMKLNTVEKITTDNLDMYYPENARLVMTRYCDIRKVLFSETYTQEQFGKLVEQLAKIYDAEFLAAQTDLYAETDAEVIQKKTDGYSISDYKLPDSDREVEYFTQDGRDFARMKVTFSIRNGTMTDTAEYTFILRKETETGRWKIMGWKLSDTQ